MLYNDDKDDINDLTKTIYGRMLGLVVSNENCTYGQMGTFYT